MFHCAKFFFEWGGGGYPSRLWVRDVKVLFQAKSGEEEQDQVHKNVLLVNSIVHTHRLFLLDLVVKGKKVKWR